MRGLRLAFLLLLAAALIWIWQNPDKTREYYDTGRVWVATKARALADSWSPPPPPAAPPEPPAPPLPDGVHMIRRTMRFGTNEGLMTWNAGTVVKEVGSGGGKLLVSDGIYQTTVEAVILTRDPREVQEIRKSLEAATQQQAMQDVQGLESELREIENRLSSLRIELRRIQAGSAPGAPASFGTKEEFVRLVIERLERRKEQINKQLRRENA